MNRHSPTRSLPATIATVAVLLSACTDNSTATTGESPTSSPSSPAGPALVSDLRHGTPLDPGPYALQAIGRPDLPLAVFDLPAGFEAGGVFLAGGDFLFGFQVIGYWSVTGIYKNPCTKQGGLQDVGHTVDDLATALASQPMIPATKPVPVSIDGHDGAYLELTTPRLDYNACHEGDVAFWTTEDGDRSSNTAGKVDRVWILDVEGNRVLLNATFDPGASEQDIEGVTRVVRSAEFTGPDGSSSP